MGTKTGVSKTRGGGSGRGPGPGSIFFVCLFVCFFKECCFRFRVRVGVNPNPKPKQHSLIKR